MKQSQYEVRPLMLSTESQFWIGNPLVELTNGRMWFQAQPTNLIVCLSIPNSQQPIEFCEFVGDEISSVLELKVLMIESPHTYAILMQFETNESAAHFVESRHNNRFNQLEEDICVLRYVQKVALEGDHESSVLYRKSKPRKTKKGHHHDSDQCAICFEPLCSQCALSPNKQGTTTNSNSIISILCGHYFHLRCLCQWNQPHCPLCRQMQQPPEVTYCELCSNSDQLWMCLICGQKYCEVHNQQHYQSTQHALQMNVDTKLVFDHASMNFVHRILINELDGKLVQMQDGKCKDSGAKLTEYLEEQNQIFTQSLESQRVYFQSLLTNLKKQGHAKLEELKDSLLEHESTLDNLVRTSFEMEQQCQQEEAEFAELKARFLATHKQKEQLKRQQDELGHAIEQGESLIKQRHSVGMEEVNHLKAEQLEVSLNIKDLQQNLRLRQQLQRDSLSSADVQGAVMMVMGGRKKKKRR